jgi:hypothetical protein
VNAPLPFPSQPLRRQPPLRPDEAAASARDAAPANVPPTSRRPLTVLLLSCDRNFRLAISLLLTRRGCSVIVGRLVEPASREPADVVVIDGGASEITTTRALQIAEALSPSVGVVLVAGAPCAGSRGHRLVARWGPFPELFAAIEQADRERRGG